MHRAIAALGPEEEVAAALEESAILARARGGFTAETALLSRSAQMSPGSRDRSRRLLGAAHAAHFAGNSVHAKALLEAARHGELDEFDRARAQLLDGMTSVPLGQGRRAPELLLEAAESLAPLDPELSRRALLTSFSALLSVLQCTEGTTGGEIGKVALNALEGGSGESTVDSLLGGLASAVVCDGEWLRRKKRRSDARVELRKAHDMFEPMGARAFAERARLELEATGERARTRHVESTSDLTVRELQIARLAADGLTSREIASQLFISPHTVEYHLSNVFQKLGIRSRIHLAKAIPDTAETSR